MTFLLFKPLSILTKEELMKVFRRYNYSTMSLTLAAVSIFAGITAFHGSWTIASLLLPAIGFVFAIVACISAADDSDIPVRGEKVTIAAFVGADGAIIQLSNDKLVPIAQRNIPFGLKIGDVLICESQWKFVLPKTATAQIAHIS